jgi:hypothetical protein
MLLWILSMDSRRDVSFFFCQRDLCKRPTVLPLSFLATTVLENNKKNVREDSCNKERHVGRDEKINVRKEARERRILNQLEKRKAVQTTRRV